MAYDVTEERLKVRGSEQITRDLKVNRDAFINGKAETGSIDDKGDLKVAGEILAGDDVTISGDLYVNGTEYINDSETAQTTDNYLVLRHNQTTPLGTDEYSGVAVHNYASGKTATITTDEDGTWRVADNTETDTDYTNISYYNGTYYTGLTRTAATVISGMKTAFDEDELDESVYYNNSYYHFDGSHWFPVSLVDNKLTLGSAVTDSTTIAALNALTKADLVYFRALTITVINPVENQPLLTRAESSDLTGGQALTWDATNQKAVGKAIDTTVTANSSNLVTSGGIATAIATAIGNCNSKITIEADTNTTYSDSTTIHVSGVGTTNPTTIKAKTALSLWDYIKGKISTAFGLGATKTDNAIARWDGTDGKLQNSGITINDSDTIVFPTISGAGGREMLRQTVGTNDVFRIYAGATGANAGYGEIATADDGSEPIYVRQYSGNFETLTRTATLLDGNGDTSFPGDIHVGPGKAIYADGTKANYAAIKFKDATDVNGNGIVIGAGGVMVIGGGESPDNFYTEASLSASNEIMAITNDNAITFVSNMQEGYANRKTMTMGTDGKLTNGYGFVGSLTGNASTADYTRGTAYCTTAANTAAKVANMRGYVLQAGTTFLITFTNANTAASALTLNINDKGAKPIYINNAASSSTNYTLPAGTYLCSYSGASYYIDTSYAVTKARVSGSCTGNAASANNASALEQKNYRQTAFAGLWVGDTTASSLTASTYTYSPTNPAGSGELETGSVVRLTFANALQSSQAITQVNLNYGGRNGAIVYAKSGTINYVHSHLFKSGHYTSAYPNKVWDSFTTLELMWTGGWWLVMGNPILCLYSSNYSNYKVYANGYVEQWGSGTTASINLPISYSNTYYEVNSSPATNSNTSVLLSNFFRVSDAATIIRTSTSGTCFWNTKGY